MRRWNLLEIETPDGSRSPVVLHSDEARAVLIELKPGQELGDHEVKERAWMTVLAGTVSISAGGESFEAGPGTLTMFEPSERRSVATSGGARLLVFFSPWPGEGHYRGEDKAVGLAPGR